MKEKIIELKCHLDNDPKYFGVAFSCTAIDAKDNRYDIISNISFTWIGNDYDKMLKKYCKIFNKQFKNILYHIPISLFRTEFKKQYSKYTL